MSATKTLPIILKTPKIVLLGAGKVGFQKAKVLYENHIDFTVIALTQHESFETLPIDIKVAPFSLACIESYHIVIDATGNQKVREQLLEEKKRRWFLLNVVDEPAVCDFYFAALLQYGALKIAVSSSGASPTIAQKVRDKIKRILPKALETLVKSKQEERKKGVITPKATALQTNRLLSKVYLVGCGTGDVELLTLRAYRLIQEVDVVFIDHLISDEIREIIPKDTLKIYVGKEKGHHTVSQEKINDLLLEYANKGLSIARLKSGDPYVFGRGAEEALYVQKFGVKVEVIPGVSSALAAPLSAGIAPTARGYASGFSVVSAHLKENRLNLEWLPLLQLPSHTTIVLMGVSRAEEITQAALKSGVNKALPAAIISNATRPNQTITAGCLKDLSALAKEALKPAILVFGEVVHLHNKLPHYMPAIEKINKEYHESISASL